MTKILGNHMKEDTSFTFLIMNLSEIILTTNINKHFEVMKTILLRSFRSDFKRKMFLHLKQQLKECRDNDLILIGNYKTGRFDYDAMQRRLIVPRKQILRSKEVEHDSDSIP